MPDNIKHLRNYRTYKSDHRVYVFDNRYQIDQIGKRPKQLNFEFRVAVADVICYSSFLTKQILSVSSDGNKSVDRKEE